MSQSEKLLQDGEVWFSLTNRRKFLCRAKKQGYRWVGGDEIDPKGDCFFHVAINKDKTIANVPMFAWVAKQYENIRKYDFEKFLKENAAETR